MQMNTENLKLYINQKIKHAMTRIHDSCRAP